MTALLDFVGIYKSYGAIPVLRNVGVAIENKETFAIIGPNGAGKTTLFKVLTGEVRADRGHIAFAGSDITHMPVYRRVALGFGRTFQVARIFPNNTVLENIVVAIESRRRIGGESLGRLFAIKPLSEVTDQAAAGAASVGLAAKARVQAKFLSHGDKKRLEIAMALALKPRILVMDEPTAGMSPSDRHETVELIRRVRAEHDMTLLLTEHDMDVVFGLASRVMVLNYGEIVAIGTPAEVRNDPAVREVYLGEEVDPA